MPQENQTTFLPLGEPLPLIREACECRNCGTEIGVEDDAISHRGELHCADCVCTCEACEETTLADELEMVQICDNTRRQQQTVCPTCRWECADCGNEFTGDSYHNAGEEAICHHCSSNYTCCDGCEGTFHTDFVRSNNNGTFCESCYEEEVDDENGPLFSHNYKPTAKFLEAVRDVITPKLYMGWELEIDRLHAIGVRRVVEIKKANLPPQVYCKEDGSLNHGFEVVSHPGTLAYWNNEFDWSWCKRLTDVGFRSYDTMTCGLHIHVSKSFLTDVEQYKLLLFFRDNREFAIRLSRRAGQKRDPNDSNELSNMESYCRIDRDVSKSRLLRSVRTRKASRYTAINLQNQHTIEFRLFRGTLNPDSVKRNLHLVYMLCHYVKACSYDKASMTTKAFLHFCRYNGAKLLGSKEAHKALYEWIKIAVKRQVAADGGY